MDGRVPRKPPLAPLAGITAAPSSPAPHRSLGPPQPRPERPPEPLGGPSGLPRALAHGFAVRIRGLPPVALATRGPLARSRRAPPQPQAKQRQDAFTHTLDTENTTQAAAIDVGANNTVTVVTEDGDTAVYYARPEFERFQRYSERIATLQSELPDDEYTSRLIQRLYDTRTRKRDHSRDAAVKHATEWLLERNVDTVYVGDLTDVLDTHWSAEVNEKTHAFWSHRQLLERIELTLGDVGIEVAEVSEADSSSECPECGSSDVTRRGDSFRCHDCELDAHSDVAGAWNILQQEGGPMARPAALSAERDRDAPQEGAYWEWNEHDWRPADFGEQSRSFDQTSVSEPARSQPG